jgi:hypothetical protein
MKAQYLSKQNSFIQKMLKLSDQNKNGLTSSITPTRFKSDPS